MYVCVCASACACVCVGAFCAPQTHAHTPTPTQAHTCRKHEMNTCCTLVNCRELLDDGDPLPDRRFTKDNLQPSPVVVDVVVVGEASPTTNRHTTNSREGSETIIKWAQA